MSFTNNLESVIAILEETREAVNKRHVITKDKCETTFLIGFKDNLNEAIEILEEMWNSTAFQR